MGGGKATRGGGGVPVDSGWAWMVLVACCLMALPVLGGLRSLGIISLEFMFHFGTDATRMATIGAACMLSFAVTAPVVGIMSDWLGSRWMLILGGVTQFVGFLIAHFAPNVGVVILASVFLGFGFSFSYGPGLIMLPKYFKKRLSFASGLAGCFSSLSFFVYPPMTTFLIDTFSLKGALLIMGALALHCCLCGALLRPLTFYTKPPPEVPSSYVEDPVDDVSNLGSADYDDRVSEADGDGYIFIEDALVELKRKRMQESAQQEYMKVSTQEERPVGKKSHSIENVHGQQNDVWLKDKFPAHIQRDMQLDNRRRVRSESSPLPYHDDDAFTKSCSYVDNFESRRQRSASSPLRPEEVTRKRGSSFLEGRSLRSIAPSLPMLWMPDPALSELETLASEQNLAPPKFGVLALLRNPSFLLFVVGVGAGSAIWLSTPFLLPPYCHEIEFTKAESSHILAAIGIADTVSRLVWGVLGDVKVLQKIRLVQVQYIVTGIILAILPEVRTFWAVTAVCIVMAMFAGSHVVYLTLLLAERVPLTQLGTAMGLFLAFQSVLAAACSQMYGVIRQLTGSYLISIRLSAGIFIFAGAVLFLDPLAKKMMTKKKEENSNP